MHMHMIGSNENRVLSPTTRGSQEP
jgi:hypothetical protein